MAEKHDHDHANDRDHGHAPGHEEPRHDDHGHDDQLGHDDHGHDDHGSGSGGHAHGQDTQGHEHGTGLVGRVRGIFGHSHNIEDKIDDSLESNERGIWALKISLVGLSVTALLQVVVVIFSGSVALLADTIHNFGDAATSIPLWIAFALTKRGVSKRYTYGYGKTEDVAGVVIVLVILFSACVAAYESVMRFINPQEVRYLGLVAAAAVIGFIGNEIVGQFRIRVGKEIGSAALIADGQHSRVDGFTSLAVLVGVLGIWAGFPLLDPLIGIAITIAILFIVKDAMRSVWGRMIDGIEPQIVDAIALAPTRVAGVRDVHQVRARWVGHKVHTDLHITVDPDLSVREAHAIVEEVERTLRAQVRVLGGSIVHVCPAATATGQRATGVLAGVPTGD